MSDISKGVVLSSLFWKTSERVFSQGVNLIIQIVLARILLPEDFGNLAIIIALVNYISVFVQAGITTAVIQKKDLSQTDINTLFTICLSIATVCYVLLFVTAPYISNYYNNPDLTTPIRVTSGVLFLYSYNSIQMGILSRNMDFKVIFFRTAVSVIVSGVIGIFLAYRGFGLWALIVQFVSNILLASLVMAIGNKTKIGFGFSVTSAKEIYSFSIKILGANIISGFSDLFRTMSIGKKYTVTDLAYYDRGYTYATVVLQVVNSSVQGVLLPVFSRKQDDVDRLKEMARRSIRVIVFVMTPVILGAAAISKPLILLLLTEKWLACVPFFMIFCVFRWAECVVGVDIQVILAKGKSSIFLYYEILLLIANVIMLLITIPISTMAVAMGALVVHYVACFALILIARKLYSYSLRERFHDVVKPILNSLVMIIVVTIIGLLHINSVVLLILQVIVGASVYILLAHLTKDDNLSYIKSLMPRRK